MDPPPFRAAVEVGPEVPGTHEVDAALSGEPATRRRAAGGSGLVVLSAAHPVRAEGRVGGAVLVQEAATDILAVACPYCLQMFEDSVKTMDLPLEVKDVAELLAESL